MRRLLFAFAVLFLSVHSAFAALALDGSTGVLNSSGGTTASMTLSTTSANDVIVVSCAYNGAVSITSVTGAGLTFTSRAKAGNTQYIDEWYALASSALSDETITVTFSSNNSYDACSAFGISGANTSAPYDTNASLPVQSTAAPTYSTSNPNDFIISLTRTLTATPTPTSGWTSIYAPTGGYYLVQYQIVSAVQTNATIAVPGTNGTIADAVVQASTTGCTHGGYSSMGVISIPNGTSGSYWLKNGTFGTPDCSTVNYWQPTVGNFGVN